MIKWTRVSILDTYNLAIGLFLVISPWLLASIHGVMGVDAWIVGAMVVTLSIAALFAFAEWEEWGMLFGGFWLAMSPWVLGYQNTTAMKWNIGAGILIAFIAGLELWLIHYENP